MGDDGRPTDRPTDRLFVSSLLGRSVRYSSSHNSVRQISAGVGKGGTAGRRNGKEGEKQMEGGRYSLSVDDDRSVLDERQILHLLLAPQEGSSVIDHLQHLGRVLQEQPHPLTLCSAALHVLRVFFPKGTRRRGAMKTTPTSHSAFDFEMDLPNVPNSVSDQAHRVRRIRFHFLDRGVWVVGMGRCFQLVVVVVFVARLEQGEGDT